jgi:hypothetical protein
VVIALVVLAVGVVHAATTPAARDSRLSVTVTVAAHPYGTPVANGFLGLSLEYWAIDSYAGQNPRAVDPVFEALVRNLAPGQSPVLRIGGDSSDWTWWPVTGRIRPPGVTFALTPRWAAVTRALTRALRARLLLGLNLEADSSSLAAAEADALLSALGSQSILAFTLGNEPSLYGIFPWYRTPSGREVPGRPPGYDFAAFLRDFSTVAAGLPAHALAGPSFGGPGWIPDLGRFLVAEPAVRVVTVHRYPLQLCLTPRSSPRYPTLTNLLAPSASQGLAAQFEPAVAAAHARGLPLRIDELNTVACGAVPAVSQTFASALWSLDALFALKRAGVDGVQMHTFPGAGYELFQIRHTRRGWQASVRPEYYGLLMFAAAAPAGARLLPVSGSGETRVRIWATAGPDGRIRAVIINPDPHRSVLVRLRLPASAPAALDRLVAPSLLARTGIALGGQSFGASTATGRLATPRLERVTPSGGAYVVSLAPASAALLTVPSARADRSAFPKA